MPENSCRHFRGFRGFPGEQSPCALGRDPRAWVVRICGTDRGLFYKVPCTKQSEEHAPVFDCPGLDRKTQEEVDAERQRISERMDMIVKALPKVQEMKRKMVAKKLPTAVATCPWCGEKDALKIGVALGVNNHVRCHCSKCGEGFTE